MVINVNEICDPLQTSVAFGDWRGPRGHSQVLLDQRSTGKDLQVVELWLFEDTTAKGY